MPSDPTNAGLLSFALAHPFLFCIWLNRRTGVATIHWGLRPVERRRHPVGFMIIQCVLGFFASAAILVGILVITRLPDRVEARITP